MEDEPVIVDSGLSQEIEVDGYTFEINIYRLEEETTWTLEVVDEDNTSHVWNDTFASDFAALVEAQKAIRTVGAEAFMHDATNPTLH
jgi:TolB-like protein